LTINELAQLSQKRANQRRKIYKEFTLNWNKKFQKQAILPKIVMTKGTRKTIFAQNNKQKQVET
jgi:hypothetical protein